MRGQASLTTVITVLLMGGNPGGPDSTDPPFNTWTQVCRDQQGARRNSSFRWVQQGDYFLLWGFMGHVTDDYGSPEEPWDGNVEYDLVAFDPRAGKWESQFPYSKETEWQAHAPPVHECNSYQGITTGSYRPQLKAREGVLRPDLNIVFDQVTYDSKRARMIYFTGGRTFSYGVGDRLWSDAAPGPGGPPPVSAASLCYDPFNDEIVLSGGGHVAEKGPGGALWATPAPGCSAAQAPAGGRWDSVSNLPPACVRGWSATHETGCW